MQEESGQWTAEKRQGERSLDSTLATLGYVVPTASTN
jgi:hypothetical protein